MVELTKKQYLDLYYYMKLNRLLEERLVNLYRQGKVIGGLYRSLGQEATSVGSAYALEPGDIVSPLIRNLGSLLVKGVKPREVLTQYMARATSPTRGRDLNVHFGDLERGFIGPISMLGDMISVLAGMALAARMQGKRTVALTYIGDGATSTGAFHEGMNFASVQKLPLVVIAEHNAYAYSTPTSKQMNIKNIADRALAYGIAAEIVDGNDVLKVYEVTRRAVERARNGEGTMFIESKTFRRKGHAEHDDQRYVPKELLQEWEKKDPIDRYERFLLDQAIAAGAELQEIVERINQELDEDVRYAEESPFPDPETALGGVYAEEPKTTTVPGD